MKHKSNPWLRLYSEFASDPKVQSMPEEMQRRLIMLFCLRCSNTLVTLHETEIAFALRINDLQLTETKALFLRKGFINEQWEVMNWDKRQFVSDSSAARVAAYRERKREQEKQACNVTVTSQIQNRTDTELKPIAQNGFARFWLAYPKKKSKGDAERAFKSIKPSEQLLEQMLSAIAKAKTSDDWKREAGQFIPYPATWLRAKSWEDEVRVEVGGSVPIKSVVEQVPSLAEITRRSEASDKAAEEARQKLRQLGRVRSGEVH